MLAACGAAAASLGVAPVLVLGSVWDEPRVVDFRASSTQVGAALVVGMAGIAALVVAFRRWSQLFAIAAFALRRCRSSGSRIPKKIPPCG